MDLKKIVITLPYMFNGEGDAITRMLNDDNVWRIHIRKPSADEKDIRQLIESIPTEMRSHITIHDYFNLAQEYGLGGIHLNSRNPVAPPDWHGIVSRSLHSVDRLLSIDADYAFISPVFDSISKPGYHSKFDIEELKPYLSKNIIALGGVTPDKFRVLEQAGFGGAAMIGAAWQAQIDLNSFRLQFITHPSTRMSIVDEVTKVIEGGCRWVQLRMKDATETEIIEIGKSISSICHDRDTTFIIDDHVNLVDAIGADGVHLGKNDMPVEKARIILGPMKIIGATANTFDDLLNAYAAGANYAGVGPFRFTETKKNLSPILGVEGYQRVVTKCQEQNINLPIVAIGGITDGDIPSILSTGVNGIALSGTILRSNNMTLQTKNLLKTINQNI